MACDWSEVPCELLSIIAQKSETIPDFVIFPAVCQSWNSVWKQIKTQWDPPEMMPWLMLSENPTENPDCYRKVFDPNTQKTFQIKLPHTFGRRCFGSNCGWVLTLVSDLEIHLFNPLTSVRLDLPRMVVKDCYDPDWCRVLLIRRVLVVQVNGQLLVIMVHHDHYRYVVVSFARPGDSTWTEIELPELPENVMFPKQPENLVYWKGLVLILTSYHGVLVWDCNLEVPKANCTWFPDPERLIAAPDLRCDRLYLVDCFGDLLLVQRIKKPCDDPYPEIQCLRTQALRVYRLKVRVKLEELKELGDVSLFLGDNSSMAIRASEVPNCIPNRVYVTDDESYYWDPSTGETGGFDMGIYRIGDGEYDIETFYQGDDTRSAFCTPFWFLPRLK